MTAPRRLKSPCRVLPDRGGQRAVGLHDPVWSSQSKRHDSVSNRPRVAISASDDRNGQKFRNWVSQEAFEVDFSSDLDPLLAMIGDTPHRWSTLILDVANLHELGDVAAIVEMHRHIFMRLFIIFLCNRHEQDEIGGLLPDGRCVVLTKPFTRFQLLATLTCRESPKLATSRHIGLHRVD